MWRAQFRALPDLSYKIQCIFDQPRNYSVVLILAPLKAGGISSITTAAQPQLRTVASQQLVKGARIAPRKLPELDGIRGIAILMVIFHHLSQAFPVQHGLLGMWLAVTKAGWLGVDIFFALSGFLITKGLLEAAEKPNYYRNFYSRRFLRLAPLYLIALLLVALTTPHSGPFLALSLLYLANFAKPLGIAMSYGPLWSLSVEEHFYMVWPAIAKNTTRKRLLWIAIAVCALTPLVRFLAYRHSLFDPYVTWFRLDGLAWGAIIAIVLPAIPRRTALVVSRMLMLFGSIVFIVSALTFGAGRSTLVGTTLVYGDVALTTAGLICYIALNSGAPGMACLRNRGLTFFGEISYWVYLFHALVVDWTIQPILNQLPSPLAAYLVFAAVVLGAAALTGVVVQRYIEKPVAKLKSRFAA